MRPNGILAEERFQFNVGGRVILNVNNRGEEGAGHGLGQVDDHDCQDNESGSASTCGFVQMILNDQSPLNCVQDMRWRIWKYAGHF